MTLGYTVCGKKLRPDALGLEIESVTCLTCLKIMLKEERDEETEAKARWIEARSDLRKVEEHIRTIDRERRQERERGAPSVSPRH